MRSQQRWRARRSHRPRAGRPAAAEECLGMRRGAPWRGRGGRESRVVCGQRASPARCEEPASLPPPLSAELEAECVRVSGKERVWRSFERTNAEALKRVCAHCGARVQAGIGLSLPAPRSAGSPRAPVSLSALQQPEPPPSLPSTRREQLRPVLGVFPREGVLLRRAHPPVVRRLQGNLVLRQAARVPLSPLPALQPTRLSVPVPPPKSAPESRGLSPFLQVPGLRVAARAPGHLSGSARGPGAGRGRAVRPRPAFQPHPRVCP